MVPILKSFFPHATVSMLLRDYTKDIALGYAGLSEVLTYDRKGKTKPFFEMLAELRRGNYDLAVVAFPRFRIAFLLWLAGIGTRLATGYRWYSFLFNRRVFEHRKTGQKHEAEYNVGLLKGLGLEVPDVPRPRITIPEEDRRAALAVMHEAGIQKADTWVIVHPGSGGSARDWKRENFGEIARLLANQGYTVVVTGGPGEEQIVGDVVRSSQQTAIPIVGKFGLNQLAAFVSFSSLFISNSTGPLHIAAAVDVPVIGFYPDIPACSPTRWGPLTEKKKIFVPDRAKCPLCKGGECRSDICMDQIKVEDVLKAANELLASEIRKPVEMPL